MNDLALIKVVMHGSSGGIDFNINEMKIPHEVEPLKSPFSCGPSVHESLADCNIISYNQSVQLGNLLIASKQLGHASLLKQLVKEPTILKFQTLVPHNLVMRLVLSRSCEE